MREHLPLARFLVGLFLLEAIAFAGQGVHLLRRFALLQAVHEVGGFLQTLRRAASGGAVLILGGRAFHIFLGLPQIVQGLLHALIGLLRSALLLLRIAAGGSAGRTVRSLLAVRSRTRALLPALLATLLATLLLPLCCPLCC